jgi:F0F1-type ATP synthase assembly protein I
MNVVAQKDIQFEIYNLKFTMSKKPPVFISAGILAQLSVAIVVAIVVPLVIGIALSRAFNWGPIAILVAMVIGVSLGAYAVYRIVKDAYEQLGGGK